ncbi:MAG: aminopeptidase [bacterium]
MTSAPIERMASVLTKYSLALRPGELFLLQFEPAALPLARAVFRCALAHGAHPRAETLHPGLAEDLLRHGSDEQLEHVSELDRLPVEQVDARLNVRAPENLAALGSVPAERLARHARARRPLFDRVLERRSRGELRTTLTQYPTEASAQQAGMSLEEYETFIFNACLLDRDDPVAAWRELSAGQQRYVELLDGVRELHFEAAGTDLRLSVAGRSWVNSDGRANFPSGEVFTGPVEDSAEGRVKFDVPAFHLGRQVEDVVLEFRAGRVVGATAARGENLLRSRLETDDGASRLGEVAFGLNYGISRPTGNILFDEKIGGTIHLALGAGYPDTGSANRSAIHWDLIRTMSPGRVRADGRVIYEDGRFTT